MRDMVSRPSIQVPIRRGGKKPRRRLVLDPAVARKLRALPWTAATETARSSRLGPPAASVLHLALLAGLVLWPGYAAVNRPEPPPVAVRLTLVPAKELPLAPPTAIEEPPARPIEPPSPPSFAPPTPELDPLPEGSPLLLPCLSARAAWARAEAVIETDGPPEAAPPAPPPFDARAAESNYWHTVRASIAQHLRYPPDARRRGLEGRVNVSVVLDGRGGLSKVDVVDSSSDQFTRAVLAAVRAAAPFAASDTTRTNVVSAVVPVEFRLNTERALE